MGQLETDMGNHSKVITGQKYSTPVSTFSPVIILEWFPNAVSMILQVYPRFR